MLDFFQKLTKMKLRKEFIWEVEPMVMYMNLSIPNKNLLKRNTVQSITRIRENNMFIEEFLTFITKLSTCTNLLNNFQNLDS